MATKSDNREALEAAKAEEAKAAEAAKAKEEEAKAESTDDEGNGELDDKSKELKAQEEARPGDEGFVLNDAVPTTRLVANDGEEEEPKDAKSRGRKNGNPRTDAAARDVVEVEVLVGGLTVGNKVAAEGEKVNIRKDRLLSESDQKERYGQVMYKKA